MTTYTPPVCRCPRCRGWLTRRTLDTNELAGTIALVCCLCAWDYELIGGRLVEVTYRASQPSPTVPPLAPPDKSGWRERGRPRRGLEVVR